MGQKSRTYTGLFPLGSGVGDNLSNALLQERSRVNRGSDGDQAEESGGELNHNDKKWVWNNLNVGRKYKRAAEVDAELDTGSDYWA